MELSKDEQIFSKYQELRKEILSTGNKHNSELVDSNPTPSIADKIRLFNEISKNSKSEAEKKLTTEKFRQHTARSLHPEKELTNSQTEFLKENKYLDDNEIKIKYLENRLDFEKTVNKKQFDNLVTHYENILKAATVLKTEIEKENSLLESKFTKIKENIRTNQNELTSDFTKNFEFLLQMFENTVDANDQINEE